MMAPTHHLDDAVLLDYITGASSEPVGLVAACHLTLCAVCRERAAAAESVGGALLERAPMAALSEGALERVLARLDEGAHSEESTGLDPDGIEEPLVFAGVPLPRPLAPYLRRGSVASDAPPDYHFLAPGVRAVDIPTGAPAAIRTRLLKLAPGVEIPRHAHAAPEFTLVFSGGLTDEGEHYGPGDIRFRDAAAVHQQRVDLDGPCVALVVNEGALLPRTWRGRLASLLFDR